MTTSVLALNELFTRDSVAAVTWKALYLAGVHPSRLQAHGRLFGARS